MERVRASSLESNRHLLENNRLSIETMNRISTIPHSSSKRSRINSMIGTTRDFSDDSLSFDHYSSRNQTDRVSRNDDLRNQIDLLQSTVNRMLNPRSYDEMQQVNLSDALKHEYRQMINALKELETMLAARKKCVETGRFSSTSTPDNEIQHLHKEIQYRDSLIKSLSERLKVLCRANDKLIIDYENQESLLSEELVYLKRQLEKAKDALRALSLMKNRQNLSSVHEMEKELYYLRESIQSKEIMIDDLKRRCERLNTDNIELKHEIDCRSRAFKGSDIERELSYTKQINDQLKQQIQTLTDSLDSKNSFITDLEQSTDLKQQLLLANEENELQKDELVEQAELLNDLRNQLKLNQENARFKEQTICDLESSLRDLKESLNTIPVRDDSKLYMYDMKELLNTIKRYLAKHQPNWTYTVNDDCNIYDQLEQIFYQLIQTLNESYLDIDNCNIAIELVKEYLTQNISMKNKLISFISDHNSSYQIEGVDKLKGLTQSLAGSNMDSCFQNDLRTYLQKFCHSDEQLKHIVEQLIMKLKEERRNATESVKLSKSLEKDASKLENKEDYERKLKDKNEEIADLIKRLNNLEHEKSKSRLVNEKSHESKLKSEIDELKNRIEQLNECNEQKNQLKVENKRLTEELDELTRRLRKSSRELDEKHEENEKLNDTLNSYKQIKSKNEQLADEVEDLSRQLRKSSKDVMEKSSEINNLNDLVNNLKICQKENEALKAEIELFKIKLKERNDSLTKLSDMAKNENELMNRLRESKSNNEKLSDELYKNESKFKQLERDLNQKNDEIQMLMEKFEKFTTLMTDYDNALDDNENLKCRINQLEMDLARKCDEVDNLESSMDKLTEQVSQMSINKNEMKELEIDNLQRQVTDLVCQIEQDKAIIHDLNGQLQFYQQIEDEVNRLRCANEELDNARLENIDLNEALCETKQELDRIKNEKDILKLTLSQFRDQEVKRDQEINREELGLLDYLPTETDNLGIVQQMQDEINRITEALNDCVLEKDLMAQQLHDYQCRLDQNQQDFQESVKQRSSVNSLKMENNSLESQVNKLRQENEFMSDHLQDLERKLIELNDNCLYNHIDKNNILCDDDNDQYQQKIVDLEGILACMTEELNEKTGDLEKLSKRITSSHPDIDSKKKLPPECDDEPDDVVNANEQLILQKDSEIAYMKSVIDSMRKSEILPEASENRNSKNSIVKYQNEIANLQTTINEMQLIIDNLNLQLNERSDNIGKLQKLLNDKDEVIRSTAQIIERKSNSLKDAEQAVKRLTIENSSIKEEMSKKLDNDNELMLVKSENLNLAKELDHLQEELTKSKSEINQLSLKYNNQTPGLYSRTKSFENDDLKQLSSIASNKSRMIITSQKSDILPQNYSDIAGPVRIEEPTSIIQTSRKLSKDASVQQISNEIQKLYLDFEEKNNEIKDYSLKEIKNRDKKIDELGLELKLKTDQLSTIIIENRRLSSVIDGESLKSSKTEDNLRLKEEMLQKLLDEKEKIRATFITQLKETHEEIEEKNKTVYFLNAELHRLSSQLEIVNGELSAVKTTGRFSVCQKCHLEVVESSTMDALKKENDSLKLCINLKMSEADGLKRQIDIHQIDNTKLSNEIQVLKDKLDESQSLTKRNSETQDSKQQLLNKEIEQLKSKLDESEELVKRKSKSFEELENKFSIEKESFNRRSQEYQQIQRRLSETEENCYDKLNRLQKEFDQVKSDNLKLETTLTNKDKELSNSLKELEDMKTRSHELENDLSLAKEVVDRSSIQKDNEMDRLNDLNEIINGQLSLLEEKGSELNTTYQQIESLSKENNELRCIVDKLSVKLENYESSIADKMERDCSALKDKDQRLRCLERENQTIHNELMQYKELEKQLEACLKRKSVDCVNLQNEYDNLLKRFEEYQRSLENIDTKSFIQCQQIVLEQELKNVTEQLENCNRDWLTKYNQMTNCYEQLDYDHLQLKHQLDCAKQENQALEMRIDELLNDKQRLYNENQRVLDELNCGLNKDKHLEKTLTRDLVVAHTQICDLSTKLSESQLKINDLYKCLNQQQQEDDSSFCNSPLPKKYGSQPSLGRLENSSYLDLQNRFISLCSQVDYLNCQMKKRDQMLMESNLEIQQLTNKISEYEQMEVAYNNASSCNQDNCNLLQNQVDHLQCEFEELSNEHSQLQLDYEKLKTRYYEQQNTITIEMKETINNQNQQIDELKSSHQILETDYQLCCGRLKLLENHINQANNELGEWRKTCLDKSDSYKVLNERFCLLEQEYCQKLEEVQQDLIDKISLLHNLEQELMDNRELLTIKDKSINELRLKLEENEYYYEQEICKCQEDICLLKKSEHKLTTEYFDEMEMKVQEIQRLTEYCHQLELKYENFCLKYNDFKEDNDKISEKLQSQCDKIELLSNQIYEKDIIGQHLNDDKQTLQNQLIQSQCRLAALSDKLEELNIYLEEKEEKLYNMKLSFDKLNQCMNQKDEEYGELRLNMEELNRQMELMNDEIGKREDERVSLIESFKKEMTKSYDEIEELKEQNCRMVNINDSLEEELRQKFETINCQLAEIESLEAQLRSINAIDALNEENQHLVHELELMKANSNNEQQMISELRIENDQLEHDVKEIKADMENEQCVMLNLKKENDDLLHELNKVQNNLENERCIISNLTQENEEVHNELNRIKDVMENEQEVINNMRRDSEILNNELEIIKSQSLNEQHTISNLKQINEELQNELDTRKSASDNEQQIVMDLKQENEELHKDLNKIKNRSSIEQQMLVDLKNQNERISLEFDLEKSLKDQNEKSVLELRKSSEKLSHELSRMKESQHHEEELISELRDANDDLKNELNRLQRSKDSDQQVIIYLRNEIEDLQQELNTFKSNNDDIQSIFTLKKENEELKEKLSSMKSNLDKDKDIISNLRRNNEHLNNEMDDLRSNRANENDLMSNLKRENKSLHQELEVRKHSSDIEQVLTNLKRRNKELTKELDEFKGARNNDEKVILDLKQENANLNEKISMLDKNSDNIRIVQHNSIETQTVLSAEQLEPLGNLYVGLDINHNIPNEINYATQSPSPISDIIVSSWPEDNVKMLHTSKPTTEKLDIDQTYSSSKSVAWKSTHTPENKMESPDNFKHLQEAVEEYETLISNFGQNLSVKPKPDIESSGEDEDEYDHSAYNTSTPLNRLNDEGKSDMRTMLSPEISGQPQKMEGIADSTVANDIVVVDMEPVTVGPITDQNIQSQTTSQVDNITNEKDKFQDIVTLLRQANISRIHFDENKETLDDYLTRVSKNYTDLEQFYLASVKIQSHQPLHTDLLTNIKSFDAQYNDVQHNLMHCCNILSAKTLYQSVENKNEPDLGSAEILTQEDLVLIRDIISSQIQQHSAVKIVNDKYKESVQLENNNEIETKLKSLTLGAEYHKLFNDNLCKLVRVNDQLVHKGISSKPHVNDSNDLHINELIKGRQKSSQDYIGIKQSSDNKMDSHDVQVTIESDNKDMNYHENNTVKKNQYNSFDSATNNIEPKLEHSQEQIVEDVAKEKPPVVTKTISSYDNKLMKFPNSNNTEPVDYVKLESVEPVTNKKGPIDPTHPLSTIVEKEDNVSDNVVKVTNIEQGIGVNEGNIIDIDDVITQSSKPTINSKVGFSKTGNIYKDDNDKVSVKDRAQIYSAEIDYLNEKNLLTTFAINTMLDMGKLSENSNFINTICSNLTNKAQSLIQLMKEFDYEIHLSKDEKLLIDKILDPNQTEYSFRKLLIGWIEKQKMLLDSAKITKEMNSQDPLTEDSKVVQKSVTEKSQKSRYQYTPPEEQKLSSILLQKENEDLRTKLSTVNSLQTQLKQLKDENDSLTKEKEVLNSEKLSLSKTQEDLHKEKELLSSHTETLIKEKETLIKEIEVVRQSVLKSGHDSISNPLKSVGSKSSKIPLLKGSSYDNVQHVSNKHKFEDAEYRVVQDLNTTSRILSQSSDLLAPFKNTKSSTNNLETASNQLNRSVERINHAIKEIRGSIKDTIEAALLKSTGTSISPRDVKLAIANETSIDHLKNFANLLAEDNFDLAAEIEKLLTTIEELRKQLKENCDILSETVEMLQNSENLVNSLEDKLDEERRKTKHISDRVDKLNKFNKDVIVHLKSILGDEAPKEISESNPQSEHEYLRQCLIKLGEEKKELIESKEKTEKQLKSFLNGNLYSILGDGSDNGVDFEFESKLLPSGLMEGTITFQQANNEPRAMSLTFNIQLTNNTVLAPADFDRNYQYPYKSKRKPTTTSFIVEREPIFSKNNATEMPKNLSNNNNTNNNSSKCHDIYCFHDNNHSICSLSSCSSIEALLIVDSLPHTLIDVDNDNEDSNITNTIHNHTYRKNVSSLAHTLSLNISTQSNYNNNSNFSNVIHNSSSSDVALHLDTDQIDKFLNIMDFNTNTNTNNNNNTNNTNSSLSNKRSQSMSNLVKETASSSISLASPASSVSSVAIVKQINLYQGFVNYRKPIYFRNILNNQ